MHTADISSSAIVNIDVEIITRAACVLADEALLVCFLDGPLQGQPLIHVLSPVGIKINVCRGLSKAGTTYPDWIGRGSSCGILIKMGDA